MMFRTFVSLACLAAEANLVVGLRLRRIGLGGVPAWDESVLMIAEKVSASSEAVVHLATGRTFDSVVSDYRAVVRENMQRLSS